MGLHKIIFSLAVYFIIPIAYAMEIERVSVSSAGDQADNRSSGGSLSFDGRFVAFSSDASNLVVGDTNDDGDVFVKNRDTGVIERVSVSSVGDQANRGSGGSLLSADGRFVMFTSVASNLVTGDTNSNTDVFVHDRDTRVTERVSVSSTGAQANRYDTSGGAISADGRFVVIKSDSSNLVAGDTNDGFDVFVHDRNTGITERVSVSSSGDQSNSSSERDFERVSISGDGRFVTFTSSAGNLVAGDANNRNDVFLHDRDTAVTELINVSPMIDPIFSYPLNALISADGRSVVFESFANHLVDGDTNGRTDIFVLNRETDVIERISVSSAGDQANGTSSGTSISADGRFVGFSSDSNNLVDGDTNTKSGYLIGDFFVHDRDTGITERVNVSAAGEQANNFSYNSSISGDGRSVVLSSTATNLVAGDTNNKTDIFVTENSLSLTGDALTVILQPSSGATQAGEYTRFRAKLTNTTNQTLTGCHADIINPLVNWQREFSYYTRPLNVANPVLNSSIDIAPGETGQFILAVLPRVAMRKEVRFNYICNSTQAFTIPFLNTLHLTAKTEPLISEDFVELTNAFPKTQLEIDRNNGKYWATYTVLARNTGLQPTSVNLTTTGNLAVTSKKISPPNLCEPVDPDNGDWSCQTPRADQLQVELAVGEAKKIRVFVHAFEAIEQQPIANRIVVEARDQAGEVVAKTSMGISTLD